MNTEPAALRLPEPLAHRTRELDRPDLQMSACEHWGRSIRGNRPGLSSSKISLQDISGPRSSYSDSKPRQNPGLSRPLSSCTNRVAWIGMLGHPHLTDKKLHRAFESTARSANTSWAAQRSRFADLIKFILSHTGQRFWRAGHFPPPGVLPGRGQAGDRKRVFVGKVAGPQG